MDDMTRFEARFEERLRAFVEDRGAVGGLGGGCRAL